MKVSELIALLSRSDVCQNAQVYVDDARWQYERKDCDRTHLFALSDESNDKQVVLISGSMDPSMDVQCGVCRGKGVNLRCPYTLKKQGGTE